jgi:hypothetical protein
MPLAQLQQIRVHWPPMKSARFFFYFYGFYLPLAEKVERRA